VALCGSVRRKPPQRGIVLDEGTVPARAHLDRAIAAATVLRR
jgi:hypothetical protein